jgi:hypothetical protein
MLNPLRLEKAVVMFSTLEILCQLVSSDLAIYLQQQQQHTIIATILPWPWLCASALM